ncbi:MAG TPA: ATP-binding protein [Oxalicibacterium sp.]|jgi:NadR type nicotinamide-nucleotide adenylyltransferase|nr:ATP-binding protein [Oxalicibacterium sp.]
MSGPAARVAILGGESTGKSTLAAALAVHYQTIWVPEYLREFVETQQRTPHAHEQFGIASTQVEREAALLPQAKRFLFCDTTPRMTAMYSRHYFGAIDAALEALLQSHAYDFTIVTAPTNPWSGDGLMRDGDDVRQAVHRLVVDNLRAAGIPFLLADGEVAQRVQQVVDYLAARKR